MPTSAAKQRSEVALAHADPARPARPTRWSAPGSASISSWRPAHGPGSARSAPHRRGELGLPAGPAQEHHQPPGHGSGDLGRVVVLDEREGEVDAGGHAGRGPDVAVAAVDRLGIDDQDGELARRARARAQWVATRAVASPAAARTNAPEQMVTERSAPSPAPGQRPRVSVAGPARAPNPPGMTSVCSARATRRPARRDPQPRLGDDRPTIGRDERQAIARPVRLQAVEYPVGCVEHLPRPDEIKTLDSVVTGEDDLDRLGAARHGTIVPSRCWRQ